jgi:cob(I)alamin adenosyltransferase
MSKLKRGYIQIYTGNGKGKTTAALGLALRAAGYGLKTYIIQFMKEYPYNELNSLCYLSDWIKIEQCCKDDFVYEKTLPDIEERNKAKTALNKAESLMLDSSYDIIILDEILVSIYFKLIELDDVISFLDEKPDDVELILTGRYCPDELISKADLVTEMKEVKHYYTKGVLARAGIES